MHYKIVTDSSADLLRLDGVEFAAVPLTVRVGKQEYVDDAALDVDEMVRTLHDYQGRTSTACPSAGDWLAAFEGADAVYAVTITGALSGAYNAAMIAKETYEQAHPGARVFVLDTRSTGPEMRLIVERLRELCLQQRPPEVIWQAVRHYAHSTRLLFTLESLDNFAKNGRVNPAIAAAVGLLGIRIVGCASDKGELQPLAKCRGEQKALAELLLRMDKMGYRGGKVRIDHCCNESAALKLRHALLQKGCHDIEIHSCRGLCSYYAEKGGVLVGFETSQGE